MNDAEVNAFEAMVARLDAAYEEVSTLSKKKPDDAINKFKLRLINKVLVEANSLLGNDRRPFDDFFTFSEESLPSNSDVVFILSSYQAALEKLRADNIKQDVGQWYWLVDGKKSAIRTLAPRKLIKD